MTEDGPKGKRSQMDKKKMDPPKSDEVTTCKNNWQTFLLENYLIQKDKSCNTFFLGLERIKRSLTRDLSLHCRPPSVHKSSEKLAQTVVNLLAPQSQSVLTNQRAGLGLCASYASSWWKGGTRRRRFALTMALLRIADTIRRWFIVKNGNIPVDGC